MNLEFSHAYQCPRVELSKGYRISNNLAWADIVYTTQQVEFGRVGLVKIANGELCRP